ncbi:cGMP-dependent protein kinase-like [Mauremys mutica]|uniref:cGMP-dependent protein kinase-like n=1 Tax=Mauremys mutica TaxID=74926 RepID=UPI001D1388E6|nr:cGMP-dependent protein kinase-like [Mauremys mutica]
MFLLQFPVLQASECEHVRLPGNQMNGSYQCLRKFRRAVLVIQVIRNLIKMYRDYAESRAELLSFSRLQFTGSRTETENLLFDSSYFKAKVETTISHEAQAILSGPPENRTSEGIKLAMLSLKATVSTFSEYPVHIQEKLAQMGWYECFGPGRVVIRQGHIPQNFYLILSGTAVVTKVAVNRQTGELYAKTVAFLKKGKYFGDVAILTGARRNATVVCHDTVSLLAVSRQEFLNIFLNRESGEGPDFMNFLHKIELLSGWPVEKLPYNNPRICAFTFFRPGTVITKDSKASSKIYVIKTGRLRVLKAMTSSKPRLSLKSFRYSQLYCEPISDEGYSYEALTKVPELDCRAGLEQ